ncbi:MAG: chemotaxis protein CheX [Opitutaceae bacterium]|nr:chemotaxis protein CheX [Opitutaceae bacterium]
MPAPAAAPAKKTDDLAKRFGLAPTPESVLRLTQLVARREASAEDVAKIIAQDKGLAARLLRAANPRADTEEDYSCTTVEDALARIGMSWVLLLAMTDPLNRAVKNAFSTLFNLELNPMLAGTAVPFEEEHVRGEVTFSGRATGLVHIRMMPSTAATLAARLLGLSPAELDEAAVNDVIGELNNIVAGNFKSNLCDAGLDCKLAPPQITRTTEFELFRPDGNVAERCGFRGDDLDVFIDISVNPWTD